MHRIKLLLLIAIVPLVLAGCSAYANQAKSQTTSQPATQQPSIATGTDAQLGTFLTDPKGMTLYMYTKDQPNVSNCYDQCAQNWPPLLVTTGSPVAAAGLAGMLGLTTRKDGSKQVTYNGVPLYYWVKDTKP